VLGMVQEVDDMAHSLLQQGGGSGGGDSERWFMLSVHGVLLPVMPGRGKMADRRWQVNRCEVIQEQAGAAYASKED